MTLKILDKFGYPGHMLHSKSWAEYALPDAPRMDYVLSVCGAAAGEICPIWPGFPTTAHWGIPDPAAVQGTAKEKDAAFAKAFNQLKTRVVALLALPFDHLDNGEILARLRAIRQLS